MVHATRPIARFVRTLKSGCKEFAHQRSLDCSGVITPTVAVQLSQSTIPLTSTLDKNWVFDGNEVNLYGARGEYVSFQLVVKNNSNSPLKGILVNMDSFKSSTGQFNISSELFLEWAVQDLAVGVEQRVQQQEYILLSPLDCL